MNEVLAKPLEFTVYSLQFTIVDVTFAAIVGKVTLTLLALRTSSRGFCKRLNYTTITREAPGT